MLECSSAKKLTNALLPAPRQGPTYVLDKSALPVPQTGSYNYASLVDVLDKSALYARKPTNVLDLKGEAKL